MHGETIDALLRVPGFAAYEGPMYRDIIGIRLDGLNLRRVGERIGDLPPDFGFINDIRNSRLEVISVANVLVSQGLQDTTLVKRERPDFVAETPAGRILIEHTRAFTGYQEGSIDYLFRGMASLRGDAGFMSAIGDLNVIVTIERSATYVAPLEALEDPRPKGFLGKRDAQNILAEFRRLAEAGYFCQRAGSPRQHVSDVDAPTLAKFRSTIQVDEDTSPESVGVHVGMHMWKPGKMSLLEACLWNIDEKTEAVGKYPEVPDWLVIQVVDLGGEWVYDLADRIPDTLGPFRKVFVLYWHDWRRYVASWSADADGIKAECGDLG